MSTPAARTLVSADATIKSSAIQHAGDQRVGGEEGDGGSETQQSNRTCGPSRGNHGWSILLERATLAPWGGPSFSRSMTGVTFPASMSSVRTSRSSRDSLGERRQSASDGDDELSSGVPLLQLPDGFGDLAQGVGPADDRGELAGLDELPQDHQVVLARLGGQHP